MKALVLSGGGVKGAYQVGALRKWMYEDGSDYDLVAGISVGALNAATLCQTPVGNPKTSWEVLNAVWSKVSTDRIKKRWFPFGVVESLWKKSVYNSEPLHKWISSGLDLNKLLTSGRRLRVVAVSLDSGATMVASETTPQIQDWISASAAFPVMLSPVQINGELWVDGGLRSITPLGEAIRAGATEVDMILCSNPSLLPPFKAKEHAAVPAYLMRSLDIMTSQILADDLRVCGMKNELSERDTKYRKIKLRVLQPSVPELTPDSLDFSPDIVKQLEKQGYEDACKI
jgi:NTE family protein